MNRIVTDPDGSRWVSVNVSPQMMAVLKDCEKMRAFEESVSREFWRAFAKKVDADVMGLFDGPKA